MRKIVIYAFIAIVCFSISACENYAPAVSPEKIGEPQFSVAKKTSLEVYRNGKSYEIVIGYDSGRAPFYATPTGKSPEKWSETVVDGAEIESYSDFDKDGEAEIVVSKFSCGTYCVNWLLAYKYNSANDNYFVADEIGVDLKEQIDLDHDSIPEFIVYDGFCFRWCSHGTQAYSALTILEYNGDEFSDATAQFPELVQEDANRLLDLSKTNEHDSAYITLPGYLFNMYRLDKIEEGRRVFNEVCNTVIKSESTDCESFRLEVEESILGYKFRP